MLSSLYIKNFRSILELTVDFSYGEGKAPNGWKERDELPFVEPVAGTRLVPCMAFFGANASGKTNIIRAVYNFLSLLAGTAPAVNFDPNKLNERFADTTLAATYISEKNSYEYRLTYDREGINEESLKKNGKLLYEISNLRPNFTEVLPTPEYTREKLQEILRVECSDGQGKQITSFLHKIGRNYQGLNKDLKAAFEFFNTKIVIHTNHSTIPIEQAVTLLANMHDGDRDAALREITGVIRRLDIDIVSMAMFPIQEKETEQSFSISNEKNAQPENRVQFRVESTHKNINGEDTVLDFKHESAGTKRLAGLVGLILYAIKSGCTLFIDELESSLHPLLLREVLSLFKKRRHNGTGAQLILTTHCTDLLDDSILRISEIALVRKNLSNGTMVKRLVDLKKDGEDIRNVTNFRKQYLQGFYSGVPHPAL